MVPYRKYGVSQLESMNAAGGGTNVPKVMNGTVYAAEGGRIGGGHVSSGDPKNYQRTPDVMAMMESFSCGSRKKISMGSKDS